jgi:hypothetical protein
MTTGIEFMFKNDREEELKQVYRLISRDNSSLVAATSKMEPYIISCGKELHSNTELVKDPKKCIPKLIELKNKIDSIVEVAFCNNIKLNDCKNKSFSNFMTKEIYSKQLANYCDYEMRTGIKGLSDPQIEERLNSIINLFKCITNKLTFQFEYAVLT